MVTRNSKVNIGDTIRIKEDIYSVYRVPDDPTFLPKSKLDGYVQLVMPQGDYVAMEDGLIEEVSLWKKVRGIDVDISIDIDWIDDTIGVDKT